MGLNRRLVKRLYLSGVLKLHWVKGQHELSARRANAGRSYRLSVLDNESVKWHRQGSGRYWTLSSRCAKRSRKYESLTRHVPVKGHACALDFVPIRAPLCDHAGYARVPMNNDLDPLAQARAQWRWRGQGRPPFALPPKPGQVSVWDFPRPPELVRDTREIVVCWGELELARTRGAWAVRETAHPPTFYLPLADVRRSLLKPAAVARFASGRARPVIGIWLTARAACRKWPGLTRSLWPGPRRWLIAWPFTPMTWIAPWAGKRCLRSRVAFMAAGSRLIWPGRSRARLAVVIGRQAEFMTHQTRKPLTDGDVAALIQMAWEDRTTFETIQERLGVSEAEVIQVMRAALAPGSFKRWRMRVKGRTTKHRALRDPQMKFDDHAIADHRRANC